MLIYAPDFFQFYRYCHYHFAKTFFCFSARACVCGVCASVHVCVCRSSVHSHLSAAAPLYIGYVLSPRRSSCCRCFCSPLSASCVRGESAICASCTPWSRRGLSVAVMGAYGGVGQCCLTGGWTWFLRVRGRAVARTNICLFLPITR